MTPPSKTRTPLRPPWFFSSYRCRSRASNRAFFALVFAVPLPVTAPSVMRNGGLVRRSAMKTCRITRSYLVALWALLFVSCGPAVALLLERKDGTLAAWYPSLYAPRAGGAYDSHHRTAGIAGRTRRRGGGVAARGAHAAAGEAAPSRSNIAGRRDAPSARRSWPPSWRGSRWTSLSPAETRRSCAHRLRTGGRSIRPSVIWGPLAPPPGHLGLRLSCSGCTNSAGPTSEVAVCRSSASASSRSRVASFSSSSRTPAFSSSSSARGSRMRLTRVLAFVVFERRSVMCLRLFAPLRDKVTSSARLIAPCWSSQAEDRVT
jgi:hypothetical protein